MQRLIMKDFEDFTTFDQDMDGYMSPADEQYYGNWVRAEDANEVLEAYRELKAMYDGLCK